jgi:hypothetical protein
MKENEKPEALAIDFENIPDELLDEKQWVCWKYQERDGKDAKIPVDPNSGKPADPSDPETWASFGSALMYYGSEKTTGIGFVFSESDHYVGIDIDDCIDADGTISDMGSEIVSTLASYTEQSPSGTGLHIIAKGNLPDGSNRRGSVEMYDERRFFTVTGQSVSGTPASIEHREDELNQVHEGYVQSSVDTEIITGGGDSPDPVSFSDEKLIEKAKAAKKGEKFARLWDGKTTDYKSHSEADAALCSHLAFWTNGDRSRIDSLFRRSGLMRPKWNEQRGDQTYGQKTIDEVLNMIDNYYDPDFGTEATDEQADCRTTIEDVKEVVLSEFNQETWQVTESVLSAHITHLLKSQSGGTGLVITGPSGSGKTTILKFFDRMDDMFYRSDDVTPASFVSHDSSKSKEQLEKIDLLPRIKQKTLISRDMAPWFAGEQEAVYKRMSIMAPLMDGDGYIRDSGSHGRRGYEGDEYRFNFIGATTPLPPRAWKAMGTVGNRLVFHEMRGKQDPSSVVDDVIQGSNYNKRVERCREIIQDFLGQVWDDADGIGTIEFSEDVSPEVHSTLEYLSELVRYARAPINDGAPSRENLHRIVHTLYSIAKGRALLNGRRKLTLDDMSVCSRIALSTIPNKRRKIIRTLLDPHNEGFLTANDVENAAGVSRPTAHNRMELLDTLGIATLSELEEDNRNSKLIEIVGSFEWPSEVEFPTI